VNKTTLNSSRNLPNFIASLGQTGIGYFPASPALLQTKGQTDEIS
jgi:hypothetical protein